MKPDDSSPHIWHLPLLMLHLVVAKSLVLKVLSDLSVLYICMKAVP